MWQAVCPSTPLLVVSGVREASHSGVLRGGPGSLPEKSGEKENMLDEQVLRDETSEFVNLTCRTGNVYELRTVGAVWSGYFEDFKELKKSAQKLSGATGVIGVYISINPCKLECLARCTNKVRRAKKDSLTSKADILRRETFLVDVDPVRLKDIMSTDAEKELARLTNQEIKAYRSPNRDPRKHTKSKLGFWLRTYHSFTNNRLAAANGYPEGHQDKHPGSVEAISRSRHP